MRVLTIAFAAAVGANMTPAALFPVGTLQSYNSVNVDPPNFPLSLPFLRKLHGAFFAFVAKTDLFEQNINRLMEEMNKIVITIAQERGRTRASTCKSPDGRFIYAFLQVYKKNPPL